MPLQVRRDGLHRNACGRPGRRADSLDPSLVARALDRAHHKGEISAGNFPFFHPKTGELQGVAGFLYYETLWDFDKTQMMVNTEPQSLQKQCKVKATET